MKKITKEHAQQRADALDTIAEARTAYNDAVAALNRAITDLGAVVERAAEAYNQALESAEELTQDVEREAEEWAGERTEKWNDSDAGSSHASWRQEWGSFSPSRAEPELPQELDELDESNEDALQELPESVSDCG